MSVASPTSRLSSVELPEGLTGPARGASFWFPDLSWAHFRLPTASRLSRGCTGASGSWEQGGGGEPGTWVKNMDSMLLVSSSDRCSGLRRPGLSLRWDMVSSLCRVESEQMGGRGTKVLWDRERPSTPSMGICDSRGLLSAADNSLAGPASDSGISFEGDWAVVTGGW